MTNNGDNNSKHNNHYDDPYIGLEDIGSTASQKFVKEANKFCLTALKDPTESDLYPKILKILETEERIPIISKMGTDEHGNDVLYNLWKDTKKVCSIKRVVDDTFLCIDGDYKFCRVPSYHFPNIFFFFLNLHSIRTQKASGESRHYPLTKVTIQSGQPY
jgi:hypothetical protein